nr:Tn3 family transposase [Streptomyces sp. I05A-00742]
MLESRHKPARDVCHGKRGTIHQAYRDDVEDQLGALGPVLNAIVLWTARYIDAAVAQLKAEGHNIPGEDLARLPPLKHRDLDVLGRYSFTAFTPAVGACVRCATRTRPGSGSTRTTRSRGPLGVSRRSPDRCQGGVPARGRNQLGWSPMYR